MAAKHHLRTGAFLVLAGVGLAGCGSPSPNSSTSSVDASGAWELSTATVDGVVVPEMVGLLLEVTGDEFSAEGACNTFGGPFGGEVFASLVGCLDEALDRNAIDESMIEAMRNGPTVVDNELFFSAPGVDLSYQPIDIPPIDELFAVLSDPGAAANESELFIDPEAGPLVVSQLFRLDHPDSAVRFYLGVDDDFISFYWSTENAGGSWGGEPQTLTRRAYAFELAGQSGSLGMRVALIPDTVAAAPELGSLGALESNVLVLDDSVSSGEVKVLRPDGGNFVLTIP